MDYLEEALKATEAVPFATIDGENVYDFQEAQKRNRRELMKEKLQGRKVKFDERPLNPDGVSYARSRSENICVNPEIFTKNVYRITKYRNKKALEFVVDYRAIKGKDSNNVYLKNIPTYIVGKVDENYKLLAKGSVSDTEFVNKFNDSLSIDDMVIILKAIQEDENSVNEQKSLKTLL